MRATLLIVLSIVPLGACGNRGHDPAWPKQTYADKDGGESIAPRTSAATVAITADAKGDDDEDVDATSAEAAVPAATPGDPEADTASPTVTVPEEVIDLGEIVIEVEDE